MTAPKRDRPISGATRPGGILFNRLRYHTVQPSKPGHHQSEGHILFLLWLTNGMASVIMTVDALPGRELNP